MFYAHKTIFLAHKNPSSKHHTLPSFAHSGHSIPDSYSHTLSNNQWSFLTHFRHDLSTPFVTLYDHSPRIHFRARGSLLRQLVIPKIVHEIYIITFIRLCIHLQIESRTCAYKQSSDKVLLLFIDKLQVWMRDKKFQIMLDLFCNSLQTKSVSRISYTSVY